MHDADLVFPNRRGGPMDHNNLYYRDYKPLPKRADLDGEGFTQKVWAEKPSAD